VEEFRQGILLSLEWRVFSCLQKHGMNVKEPSGLLHVAKSFIKLTGLLTITSEPMIQKHDREEATTGNKRVE
jgi:hypothetical protein